MKHIHLVSLLVTLAACSDPGLPGGELPAAFRVDAEVVSIEPGPGLPASTADLCTPTMADIDPAGPDWQLAFDRMHDAAPTFKEWTTSNNGDSADACARNGGVDCCRPLTTADGGWVLECNGVDGGDTFPTNRFEFTFQADGSGTSTTTRARADGAIVCVAHTAWPELLAE